MKYLLLFTICFFSNATELIFKRHGTFHQLTFQKYLKKGGDKNNVVTINQKDDLLQLIKKEGIPFTANIKGLESRHNFVFDQNKRLRVSRNDKTNDARVSQSILTMGEGLYAAGEIYPFKKGDDFAVFITNRSRKFCTPFENLELVKTFFQKLGIKKIQIIDYQPKFCRKAN